MQVTRKPAQGWQATGRAGQNVGAVDSARTHFTQFRPVLLQAAKRGRIVTLAKLVIAQPLKRIAVAVPYRHRQEVDHPSLTPATLEVARRMGAEWWIVRFDLRGECFGLRLSEVEQIGWLKPSEGRPEWFVPLSRFERMAWQEWEYIPDENAIRIDSYPARPEPTPARERDPEGRQPSLFEVASR